MNARILVVDDSPTIRRVVASILSTRDYEALMAGDGLQALEVLGQEPVDLVLLDFVMPRMNGYQFCRELRSRPELKALPVVLMSAKSDKIREQFVQQTGAIDAITKPFDARALIAVVEGALKKHGEGRGRPVPDAAAMPVEDESAFESRNTGRGGSSPDLNALRAQVVEELASTLGRQLLPELARAGGVARERASEFAAGLGRALTPEAVAAIAGVFRVRSFSEAAREALSGDVSVISIAEILQLLDLQRQSGALAVTRQGQEIVLYVRAGRLNLAASRGLHDEFRLGSYLLEDGVLDKAELEDAATRRPSTRLLGEWLVALGRASEEQIQAALERQTESLVYEVVRWKRGRFVFTLGQEHPAATRAALGLETSVLVMEGFRRVDEWRLIEGSLDFDQVLYRDPVAIERLGEDTHLTAKERTVLDVIDGQRTIREIVDMTQGSSFELCRIIYQFLNSRLVRRKG